jgi:ketosteroid isomerase-like protein
MKKRYFILLFVWINLAFLSVQAQDVKPIDIPADLREVLDNYEKHWEASDAQALAGLFTRDGFLLSRGRPPIRGWQGIADAYAESGGSRLILRAYDYGMEGEQAYIIGGYAGHESWSAIGKFTLVLKKVNDQWLIHSDMDNSNKSN